MIRRNLYRLRLIPVVFVVLFNACHRKPETLWLHGCTLHNDTALSHLGANEMVWWCSCGKKGTNTYPLEIKAQLNPCFTNMPPNPAYRDYEGNYFTNEPPKWHNEPTTNL